MDGKVPTTHALMNSAYALLCDHPSNVFSGAHIRGRLGLPIDLSHALSVALEILVDDGLVKRLETDKLLVAYMMQTPVEIAEWKLEKKNS